MDVVVTVPKYYWTNWLAEGNLPGEPDDDLVSHFWVGSLPKVVAGDRVYVVSHGRLRGYAPLWDRERRCSLNPSRSCLMRRGSAVALTIPAPIKGFQGWRYRWWDRADEIDFPDWMTNGVL